MEDIINDFLMERIREANKLRVKAQKALEDGKINTDDFLKIHYCEGAVFDALYEIQTKIECAKIKESLNKKKENLDDKRVEPDNNNNF